MKWNVTPSHRPLLIMPFLTIVLLTFVVQGWAQTRPVEGIRENTPEVHALVNARIVQAPGQVIEKGVLMVRNGTIEAIGADAKIPKDARVWDYKGLTIYPGLIESYTQMGLSQPQQSRQRQQATPRGGRAQAQQNTPRKGAEHWNPYVVAEVNAMDQFQPKSEDLSKLRKLGFTAAVVTPDDGIFSGASALVSLRDGDANDQLLKSPVAQNIMFRRHGSFTNRSYPNSLMGMIALVRQTFLDADWYQKAQAAYALKPIGQTRPEANETLEALAMAVQGKQPVMFKVQNELNFMRALNVAKEFNLRAWLMGSGHEYRYLETIKASKVPVILTLNFPKDPEVDSPEEALNVSLLDLSHWDAAPANPKWLHEAGIDFTFTTAELKNPADIHKNIRKAIERGLPTNAALAAVTTNAARLFGVDQELGTLVKGKLAHMVVTDGDLFDEKTKILDTWVDGHRYQITKKPEVDPRGQWTGTFTTAGEEPLVMNLSIKGDVDKLSGSISKDGKEAKFRKAKLNYKRLTLVFPADSLDMPGVVRMSARVESKQLRGSGELPDGRPFKWTADFVEPMEDSESQKRKMAKKKAADDAPLAFKLGAYSFSKVPERPKHVLVRGATIWTSGPDGKLKNADMLVTEGKISKIGKGLKAPSDAVIIDGKDKHVSPGLVDAHSHSGLNSVNEGSQAVTSEVRTRDGINGNDIALYRELAGGLTAANQLHGSANPIGGQNSVIKLRWGSLPEEMLISDAPEGIKFALGENVKRSRSSNNTRYPDTRMGVEQIIRDRFKAAQDYEKEWQEYNALKKKQGVVPPRRDLELDALLEILRGERLVHSHSYRQDEILMLVRVAEDFGFQIATFQHVLEGYKVAEALAAHGAGASTFSDWWAYKFEVYDAIPYNGALMHENGVVVSFNSDSGELARRMNLEAAKAVKYGGVPESEALKFVTLNPAKQLLVDHRIGSLEVGKDADFVVWSGSPLSTYSKCEQTWVDGRKYFDLEEDKKMQQQVMAERARLIQKVLASKNQRGERPGGPQRRRGGRPTVVSSRVPNTN
ncbi:amidohydrolase family protein [bacterium]|nr:amidohydrolase family protein [bacterium]